MIAQETIASAVDPDGRWLYRVGGIAAFILVVGWFLTFPLYAAGGGPEPLGAEARLIHYVGRETARWAILGVMVFTDLLFLGVALALYQALKNINQNIMLLSFAFAGLFVVLDLALLWPNHAALFNLSRDYAAAATEAQRAAAVSAAASPSAVLDSILPGIYSIGIPSLGILFASLVMLKGTFSKNAGYVGLAVAVTGTVAITDPFLGAWGQIHIVNALLATIWWLLVGYRLYKLGQQ